MQTMIENRSSIGQDFSNLNLVFISNIFLLFVIGVSNDIKQYFLISYSIDCIIFDEINRFSVGKLIRLRKFRKT